MSDEEKLNDNIIKSEDPYARKKKEHPFGRGFLVGFLSAVGFFITGAAVAILLIVNARPSGSDGAEIKPLYDENDELSEDVVEKLDKIVDYIVDYGYYDLDEVDFEAGIYRGVVSALDDDYARYFTADEYKKELVDENGSFGGIGATLQKDRDTGAVAVVSVYKGSPAEKAGLRKGDLLVSADGHEANDISLDDFVSIVRGEKGTTVQLEVYREGESDYLHIDIVRDIIQVISVEGVMLEDGIALITIESFSDNTAAQLKDVYKDLEAQGMKAIIYDLRTNGGGLLNSVTDILDAILPQGTTVSIQTLSGENEEIVSDPTCMDYPIVVLTSKFTASAAEIFTGAIQDYDYGTILGTTTYGKGIVQTIIPLGDGSALKITTSKYFTPSGRCIHGEGIEPDIKLEYEFLGGPGDEYNVYLDNQIVKAMQILGSDIKMPEKPAEEE